MELTGVFREVADIHNLIAQISVSGDDAIRMAETLQRCRALAGHLQERIETKGREEPEEAR